MFAHSIISRKKAQPHRPSSGREAPNTYTLHNPQCQDSSQTAHYTLDHGNYSGIHIFLEGKSLIFLGMHLLVSTFYGQIFTERAKYTKVYGNGRHSKKCDYDVCRESFLLFRILLSFHQLRRFFFICVSGIVIFQSLDYDEYMTVFSSIFLITTCCIHAIMSLLCTTINKQTFCYSSTQK